MIQERDFQNSSDLRERFQKLQERIIDEKISGLARELARMNLPTNIYTQWYWKTDLHNLFNFIRLRNDIHAQYEIRVYAEKIAELVSGYMEIGTYNLVWNASNTASGLYLVKAEYAGNISTQKLMLIK